MTMLYNIYLADTININILYNISYIYSIARKPSAINSRGHFDVAYLSDCIVYYGNIYI